MVREKISGGMRQLREGDIGVLIGLAHPYQTDKVNQWHRKFGTAIERILAIQLSYQENSDDHQDV